jgi:hypothetical protein
LLALFGVFAPAHEEAGEAVGDLLVVRSLAATFTVRFVATVRTCCLIESDSEKQLSDTEPSAVKREAFEWSSPLLGEAKGVIGPTVVGVESTPSAGGFTKFIPLFTLVNGAMDAGTCGTFTGDGTIDVLVGVAGALLLAASLLLCFSCFPPDWFLCSAASALLMLSCFFHLVRRFWNQIFT